MILETYILVIPFEHLEYPYETDSTDFASNLRFDLSLLHGSIAL